MRQGRPPFQKLDARAWLNLAIVALCAFYGTLLLGSLYFGLFVSLGMDFCSFWASAQIARSMGYAAVYDVEVQARFQQALQVYLPQPFRFSTSIPTFFPPVFILPFQLLLVFKPWVGFLVWTVFNFLLLLWYLWWAFRILAGPEGRHLLALTLLSFATYRNFCTGQVGVWLLLCVGEFMRNRLSERPFCSGLWLGGLLIKPQTLLLLIPGLLIGREWKSLAGLLVASLFIMGLSLGLSGTEGMLAFGQLLYRQGLSPFPGSAAWSMVNWRAVGMHLGALIPKPLATGLTVIGTVATLVIGLALWRFYVPRSPYLEWVLLGTLAATGTVAPHYHSHTAMILIPLLLQLVAEGEMSKRPLAVWALIPPAMTMLALIVYTIGMVSKSIPEITGMDPFLTGATMLFLSLYLVGRAAWRLWRISGAGVRSASSSQG